MNEITVLLFLLLKGLLVFVSTNIDDLLLLILFLAQNKSHRRSVISGQYIGFVVIIGISLLASFSSFLISPRWLSLLGIIPIIVGIHKFRTQEQTPMKIDMRSNIFLVAAFTISDGWDNVSAYTPLFANETPLHVAILISFFLLFLAVWCYIGYKVAQFAVIQKNILKVKRFLPLIYILLGILIIATHGLFIPPFSFDGRDNRQMLPQAT